MLNKNTKAMVQSPDGNTVICDVVAGVLQGLRNICNEQKNFTLKKTQKPTITHKNFDRHRIRR